LATHQSFSNEEFPVLARPFFVLNNRQENSEIVAFPGVAAGSVSVNGHSRPLGAEVNIWSKLCSGCCYRVDGLAGVRYLDLQEDLDLPEAVTFLPTAFDFPTLAGKSFLLNDRFATRDQFCGGQVGVDASYALGRWLLDVRAKVALGETHEVVDISGGQVVSAPGQPTTVSQGGLLALPSNIGHHTHDRFGVVPEVGLNVGYQVSNHVGVYMGYTFLYWSRIVRPGDQIDRVIDVTQIPNFPAGNATPTDFARPTALLRETDFWAQGLNFGAELHW
jgi:hypothetical protein